MTKILVADDEADLEVLIKQKFRRKIREQEYEFIFASNGKDALEKIQENPDKPTAYYTVWFVTLLFIFIEMAPMLLKLMTSSGAYENRISQIEATYGTAGRLRRSLDLEEYKSNRGLVQRLARSQRSIIHKAMEAWHKAQLDRLRDDPEYFSTLFNENRDNQNS